MAGKADDDKDLVRLQIPVSQALADRVAELAEQADRSQGFFAGLLLELALDCCENLPRWLGRRAVGPAGKGWGIGWRQQCGAADVRLQVKLSRDHAERIKVHRGFMSAA